MSAPVIAIVGSFRDDIVPDHQQKQQAHQAAIEIGAALAAQGFSLFVYSAEPQFAEAPVVKGYLRGKPAAPDASVTHYYPSRDNGRFDEQRAPEKAPYFRSRPADDENWMNAFYSSLYQVDGVVILGGGYSSLVCGHIALGRGIPVIPIGAFGGSAQKIWQYMTRDAGLREAGNVDSLAYWTGDSAVRCAQTLRAWHERVTKQRHETDLATSYWRHRTERAREENINSLLALVLMALFVGSLITGLLLKEPKIVFKIVFLLGLLCAGASGSTARLLMPNAPRSSRLSTLVLGALAGFVLSLLYLLPQLVGGGALVEDAPTTITAARYQLLSAMMFAFIAGVGFDLVADRFRKMGEDNAAKTSFPNVTPSDSTRS